MPDLPIDYPRLTRSGAGKVSSPDVKHYRTGSAELDRLAAEHDRIWKVFLESPNKVISPPLSSAPMPAISAVLIIPELTPEQKAPFARAHKLAEIQKVVAQHFDISILGIISKSRLKKFVHARQVAMYICRTMTGLPYPRIGEWFGGRDHTTVMHGVRKIEALTKQDYVLADEIAALRAGLEQ
jgi:hypothetical protein